MSKNSDYWKDRFKEIENASNSYGQQVYKEIESTFIKAQKEVQEKIDIWYSRIATNNNISILEAKKLLKASELDEFKWSVDEYIKYGLENNINQKWIKQLENASAKYHISRLEAIKVQTQQTLEVAFGNELDSIDKMARQIYTETYYKTAFELQKGFNIGFDVGKIDEKVLNTLIIKPWASDGKNFSDRIWIAKNTMIKELHNEFLRTCILGKSPDEAIKNMTKYVDKKFKNAKAQAGRLVMTEQAYYSSDARKDCFNKLGVEQYEIVATFDESTSEICQELDGKVFLMDSYEAGVTAPPFHVWCRSTTAPYFDDEDDEGLRAARDKDGNTFYIDDNMTYEEFKEKYLDRLKTTEENDIIKYKALNDEEIQQMQAKSDDIYEMFTDSERKAIKGYTEEDYEDINKLLAGQKIEKDEGEIYKIIDNMKTAISKFELDENVTVYRGTKFEYYADNKINDIIDGKTFYSTTLKEEITEDFLNYLENNKKVPKENLVLLEIKVPKGTNSLYVGSNGIYDNEYELLLSNDLKYKIEDINTEQAIKKIILSIV